MANKESVNFETAMKRLDEIVKLLEEGKVSLDQSLLLFEEGVKLVKECDTQLRKVEQKAAKILEGESLIDFDVKE